MTPLTRKLALAIAALHTSNALAQLARLTLQQEQAWWLLLVDVDGEANLPTWFSSMQLLLAAHFAQRMSLHTTHSNEVRGWKLLACLLLLFSIDEVARLHEQLAAGILRWLHTHALPRLLLWSAGALLVVVFLLLLVPFLQTLSSRLRNALLFAGAVFVFGGLCVEAYAHHHAAVHGFSNAKYVVLSAVEELCEMLGVLRFVQVVERELTPEAP